MSLDKLKNELSRAEKGGLDKITAKQKQELMENLTDVFSRLSKAEKSVHIQEFLDLKQHLEAAFALSEKMSSSPNKAIEKQIRLASDYQKQLEKKLGMSLLEYSTKDVVVANFDDADYGVAFAKYCEKNNIKRKDGKQIPWRGGMDPGIEYVDQEGDSLVLRPIKWGADQHDDIGAYTQYQLVKKGEIEGSSQNTQVWETSSSQSEVENAQGRENQASEYVFNLSAVLSDTQNIHQEQARLAAEELLKTKYSDISKRNVFKKGAYFLQRGRKRKKFIKDFMKNASQDAFGDQVENAASRHSRELQNGLKTIDQKAELVSIPELNLLSRGFIEGSIDEATFQTQFNSLLETNA